MNTVYIKSNFIDGDGNTLVRSQVVPDKESDISIDESGDSDNDDGNGSRPVTPR